MSTPDLPPSLKARILATAAQEPASTAASHVVWTALLAAVGLAWLATPLLLLGIRPDFSELPKHYSVGTLAFLGSSGAVLTWLALSRGQRMLGAKIEWLLAAIVLFPIAMCAWTSLVVGQGPSSHPCPTPSVALALSPPCLIASMIIGVPLALGLLWFRRNLLGGSPALTGAILGAAAATWAHMILHVHCPVAHPLHALVGHLLPIVPTATLTALLAHLRR